jgi:hypothetical protein
VERRAELKDGEREEAIADVDEAAGVVGRPQLGERDVLRDGPEA